MKSEQNIVYIAGMAVQYNRKYPGNPVIVFLHDSLGSIELWRDLPLRISGALQCNTLVYDRLGHGIAHPMPSPLRTAEYLEKEADTLSELLEELGIDNAILLGHSDGGSIALIAAAKYPDKIKAVICEAAHIFVEEITLNGIEEAINAYQNTNLPDRLAKYHGDKVDTLFRAWTETWMSEAYRTWNIEHFLPNISCPLLFIQGEADEYGTMLQVEKIIDQVSGKAIKYIIPKIGHTPHKEAPEETFQAIEEFILSIL